LSLEFLTHRPIIFLEDPTMAHYFPWGPHTGPFFSSSQIRIILHKKKMLDRATGLKIDQPIWHLPEILDGQSTPGVENPRIYSTTLSLV
jgi:hypothetical protein